MLGFTTELSGGVGAYQQNTQKGGHPLDNPKDEITHLNSTVLSTCRKYLSRDIYISSYTTDLIIWVISDSSESAAGSKGKTL